MLRLYKIYVLYFSLNPITRSPHTITAKYKFGDKELPRTLHVRPIPELDYIEVHNKNGTVKPKLILRKQ